MIKFAENLLLFLFFVVIGITIALVYLRVQKPDTSVLYHSTESQSTPTAVINFSLENSPTSAMRGTVTELKGDVLWKSRAATESAALFPATKIQQGEEVETKEDGNLTIEFSDGQSIQILPKSGLNIIQTLPDNLVFQQTDGTAIYKNTSGLPLAVRGLGLVTQFINGEAKITVNNKTAVVIVEVTKGSLATAYNDSRYETSVANITQGKKLTFNNAKKRATIK